MDCRASLGGGLATAQAGASIRIRSRTRISRWRNGVTNIISLLTPEEKVAVLGANYYLSRSAPPFLVLSEDPRLQPGGKTVRNGARQIRQPQCGPDDYLHPVHRARRDVGSGSSPESRRRGRLRSTLAQTDSAIPSQLLPVARHPCAERRLRPRHPLGQNGRVLWRGCFPERHADRRIRPQLAGQRSQVVADCRLVEALPGQ